MKYYPIFFFFLIKEIKFQKNSNEEGIIIHYLSFSLCPNKPVTHPEKLKCIETWNLMRLLHQQVTLPWICIGNFNETLSMNEK